jgi:hypothetical protein
MARMKILLPSSRSGIPDQAVSSMPCSIETRCRYWLRVSVEVVEVRDVLVDECHRQMGNGLPAIEMAEVGPVTDWCHVDVRVNDPAAGPRHPVRGGTIGRRRSSPRCRPRGGATGRMRRARSRPQSVR